MYIVGYNAIRVQYTSFLLNDSTGSFLHSLDQRLKYPNGYRSPRSLDATFELINVLWIRIFINAERLNTPQVLKPKDWLATQLSGPFSPIENFEVFYHSTFLTILSQRTLISSNIASNERGDREQLEHFRHWSSLCRIESVLSLSRKEILYANSLRLYVNSVLFCTRLHILFTVLI